MKYYLAVDIGASGGRHILGWQDQGKIRLEEVYRFSNGMERKDGHLCWNVSRLFEEIKTGMKKCREIGKVPACMGIDTWAVDYVLLDGQDCIVGKTYGYRDSRTEGADQSVYEKISEAGLYGRTGIQKQLFNTIYQLAAASVQEPEVMERAACMLMIPDYFNFLLTGARETEYTNATTTQLVSPITRDWDRELIGLLGLKKELFTAIVKPGTAAGTLTEAIREEVGFDTLVYHVGSHDTASAVAAVPAFNDDFLYISSGTWSLMGTELPEADCSEAGRAANLTNEGGYEYRFRYLKNIMGLWMIQNVKKELDDIYDYSELCRLAEAADIDSLVDCDDPCFMAPESMIAAVRDYCRNTGQPVPQQPGDLARVIYRSLARCYRQTAEELERITGRTFAAIHVVGGGSNASYLNRLTAEATGKPVLAGPGEATAAGNLAVQMIAGGELASLAEARACIRRSFPIAVYRPEHK